MKTLLNITLGLALASCTFETFAPEQPEPPDRGPPIVADPEPVPPATDAGADRYTNLYPDARAYPDVHFTYDSGPEPPTPDAEWETVGRGCLPVLGGEGCDAGLYPMVCFDADPPGGIPVTEPEEAPGQLFCSPEPCMAIPDPWRGRGCGVGEAMIHCYDHRTYPTCRALGNGTYCC